MFSIEMKMCVYYLCKATFYIIYLSLTAPSALDVTSAEVYQCYILLLTDKCKLYIWGEKGTIAQRNDQHFACRCLT